MVSCCIDGPARLFGIGDLCRHGDQMLNIPPRHQRTNARRHSKRKTLNMLVSLNQNCAKGNTSTPCDSVKGNFTGNCKQVSVDGCWRTALQDLKHNSSGSHTELILHHRKGLLTRKLLRRDTTAPLKAGPPYIKKRPSLRWAYIYDNGVTKSCESNKKKKKKDKFDS